MYVRMTQGEYATKVVYRGYGLTYILSAIAEGNLQCAKAEQFLECVPFVPFFLLQVNTTNVYHTSE